MFLCGARRKHGEVGSTGGDRTYVVPLYLQQLLIDASSSFPLLDVLGQQHTVRYIP
jgi:hypothetical protein